MNPTLYELMPELLAGPRREARRPRSSLDILREIARWRRRRRP